MNRFSAVIDLTDKQRILLALTFLTIGILSSAATGVIVLQRPQLIQSKAKEEIVLENAVYFNSPTNFYGLTYDQRLWKLNEQVDSSFGKRVILTLNREYGSARLDIIEGESELDLENLTNEIIKKTAIPAILAEKTQFQGKDSYLIKYKEDILGQQIYFYQQIIKNGNKFLIIEKRAPQLGYNQPYLDNLLAGFSFSDPTPIPQVKGVSESPTDLSITELVDLVRPSVANILYIYCLDLINIQPNSSGLSQPHYSFCGSSKGSGFIINELGFVATNGHVAKVYPEEGLVNNLLNENAKGFAFDLIKGVTNSVGQTFNQNQLEDFYRQMNANPQYLDRFLTEVFSLINKKAIALNSSYEKYYVNVGDAPVKIDYQILNSRDYTKAVMPSSTTFTASMLDLNYPNKYSYEAIIKGNYKRGADAALLKINAPNVVFPAVELGSIEKIREGSGITVVGYPTLVEGSDDPRSAVSYKSSTKPTITRGIVSAIKEDVTGKKVLQTDASIDHGNSGGPAFDSSGQAIGIATFMSESKTGNFNFLRDISELKDLMSKNKIDNQLGELTTVWRKGLDNFRKRYYTQAIKDFKQVKSISPSHPSVDEFISLSQQGIEEGKSLEGLTGFIRGGKGSGVMLIAFGSIAIVNFMLAGFMMVLPLFRQE